PVRQVVRPPGVVLRRLARDQADQERRRTRRRGPALAPGSALRRPARRTPAHAPGAAADQPGSLVMPPGLAMSYSSANLVPLPVAASRSPCGAARDRLRRT